MRAHYLTVDGVPICVRSTRRNIPWKGLNSWNMGASATLCGDPPSFPWSRPRSQIC